LHLHPDPHSPFPMRILIRILPTLITVLQLAVSTVRGFIHIFHMLTFSFSQDHFYIFHLVLLMAFTISAITTTAPVYLHSSSGLDFLYIFLNICHFFAEFYVSIFRQKFYSFSFCGWKITDPQKVSDPQPCNVELMTFYLFS
jgi:hypothetical protein